MGKSMVSQDNFHTNATRIGWHMWGIDLGFAPELPLGWVRACGSAPEGLVVGGVEGAQHTLVGCSLLYLSLYIYLNTNYDDKGDKEDKGEPM